MGGQMFGRVVRETNLVYCPIIKLYGQPHGPTGIDPRYHRNSRNSRTSQLEPAGRIESLKVVHPGGASNNLASPGLRWHAVGLEDRKGRGSRPALAMVRTLHPPGWRCAPWPRPGISPDTLHDMWRPSFPRPANRGKFLVRIPPSGPERMVRCDTLEALERTQPGLWGRRSNPRYNARTITLFAFGSPADCPNRSRLLRYDSSSR